MIAGRMAAEVLESAREETLVDRVTLVAMGRDAIDALREWGVPVSTTVGLARAVKYLEQIPDAPAAEGALLDLKAHADALLMLTDWLVIVRSLSAEPVKHIAAEIADAVAQGHLGSTAGQSLQSQFWLGSILAHGGFRPGVPRPGRRRPDFVAHLDGLDLSVEVKRPKSLASAMRAVDSAASQIRDFDLPGFVALDLSEALDADAYTIGAYNHRILPRDQFVPVFVREARGIAARINGHRGAGKWGRVLGLLTFARVHAWHSTRHEAPTMTLCVDVPVFERACSGLLVDTSRRTGNLLRRSLEKMTGRDAIGIP
jgi:hypothetical protein